jgi:hypothetical protein
MPGGTGTIMTGIMQASKMPRAVVVLIWAYLIAGAHLVLASGSTIIAVVARGQSYLLGQKNWLPLLAIGLLLAIAGLGLREGWRWARYLFLGVAILATLPLLQIVPVLWDALANFGDPAANTALRYSAMMLIPAVGLAALAAIACRVASHRLSPNRII